MTAASPPSWIAACSTRSRPSGARIICRRSFGPPRRRRRCTSSPSPPGHSATRAIGTGPARAASPKPSCATPSRPSGMSTICAPRRSTATRTHLRRPLVPSPKSAMPATATSRCRASCSARTSPSDGFPKARRMLFSVRRAGCAGMGDQLDAGVLGRWLDANGAPGDGEQPALNQLKGGSQNTLYVIERGGERLVLRMPGARADAARIDGLLREIRLVRALRGTDVPHAELIAANDVGDLLGMPFYVMRAIDGWSPMDGGWEAPFDTDLTARRGLAFELVDGAAKLGRVDWHAQGLDGFGRPDGFHERQVDRWLAFLDTYRVRELPGLDDAADWLRRNRPGHYTPGIMHGDYQFANVMFAHGQPARLAAIVDWEMTTVGDPLLDLAWALLGYDGENPRDDGFYLDMRGMPTRSELLEHYETVSGLSTENIDYYLVLANWKLGIVLEKTYAAAVRNPGKVDAKISETFGSMIPGLIATAAELARGLSSDKPTKVR